MPRKGVLPQPNACFYQNINFLTVFTMFFEGRKTTVKHDTFDKCRARVGHPRFFAISNGKKHSPPCAALVTRLAGWVVAGLVGWLVWLVWLAGWLAGWLVWLAGWLVGWLAGWLAGWLVGWLVGWLAGWLAGYGWLIDFDSCIILIFLYNDYTLV